MLLLLLELLAAITPVQAHPYHLQIANEILNGTDPVDIGSWIAQSFVPVGSFFVSRASLYVSDVGTSDILAVSIRADSGGFPASTNLTQGTADGPLAAGWLDLDFGFTELSAGQTYWIVAGSTAPGGQGYVWWNSGDELAYPPGIGVKSSDGTAWSPRGKDYAFRVYGFIQPSFTFSVASADVSLATGQSTTFQVNFTNAGSGSAAALWVNVSLPSEFTYVTDNAAAIGGVRSGTYTFSFANVAPGAYSFNMTASARGGATDGIFAVTNFTLDPTDHDGAPLGRSTRSLAIRLTAPGTAATGWSWWWLLALALGLGGLLFAVGRRRLSAVNVEQVFVADRAGLLIAHRATSLIPYEDEDIVIGMFKVVQDFVRDAFSQGRQEEMRAVEFGERKILIERGRSHSVVVVYSGSDHGKLADGVREVSSEIEERFGKTLADWDGDAEAVRDITLLLPKVWKHRGRRQASD